MFTHHLNTAQLSNAHHICQWHIIHAHEDKSQPPQRSSSTTKSTSLILRAHAFSSRTLVIDLWMCVSSYLLTSRRLQTLDIRVPTYETAASLVSSIGEGKPAPLLERLDILLEQELSMHFPAFTALPNSFYPCPPADSARPHRPTCFKSNIPHCRCHAILLANAC
jgi:hypothetical protein